MHTKGKQMATFKPFRRRNGCSPKITAQMAGNIRYMYFVQGMMQHDIAARFGVNQGRVSEVVNGARFPDAPSTPPPSRLI